MKRKKNKWKGTRINEREEKINENEKEEMKGRRKKWKLADWMKS